MSESRAKKLLEWNRQKLTQSSTLSKSDIGELFASKFLVKANERTYSANHDNYFDFLERFRANIKTLEYEVQEYICCADAVTIPLVAIVTRLDGEKDIFDVIMLVKYNEAGKIIHWQEVYSHRE
jgi:hypothetical protein